MATFKYWLSHCEIVRVRRFSKSTGGHVTRKPLNVLQWNAEGVLPKKVPLTKKLPEQVDIACIQETHLKPSNTFKIVGFESVCLYREGHKGGVLILIRNSLPSRGHIINTNGPSEIVAVDVTFDGDRTLRVFNVYCPPGKDLEFDDFNSHSNRWGYSDTDARGSEVKD